MIIRMLWGAVAALLIAVAALCYLAFSFHRDAESFRSALAEKTAAADAEIASLEESLDARIEENASLTGALRDEKRTTVTLKDELDDAEDTVKDLEKLTTMDPELLAKYSKVYFLNENYSPPALARVPQAFAFQPERAYEVHEEVAPFLEDLLEAAASDGHALKVASAYRSFGDQASLKAGYRVRYGSGANAFSADQGYSEHQLGTTVDFTTPAVGGTFAGFDKTEEYEWLKDNAWRYGFVLSYPPKNSYYQYEPWHWRFVGRELAERLQDDNDWFYDLDQRVIDGYLLELFD